MPKPNSVWWSEREGRWLTSVGGEISEKSGRPKPQRNRDIGPPTGPDRVKNIRLANEWLEGEIEKVRRSIKSSSDPTFYELVGRYLEWAEVRLEARTLEGYSERLAKFGSFKHARMEYGNRLVTDLKAADLSRFIRAEQDLGHVPNYINSIILSVNVVLNWAARPIDDRQPERILRENPFAGVARPQGAAPTKRYTGALAREAFLEYAHLRASSLDPKTHPVRRRFDKLAVCLWRFCGSTGCRPSEACRLRWPMIDWEGQRVEIKGKATDKTGYIRVIPIPPKILRILRAIHRLPGRHPDYVFTHMKRDKGSCGEDERLAGVPWVVNALDHKFRQWRSEAIKAGLPIQEKGPAALTMYAMRRDMGADILRDTDSHALSAEVLGHTPEVNARSYATFENQRAVKLASDVEARRMRESMERRRKAREGKESAD